MSVWQEHDALRTPDGQKRRYKMERVPVSSSSILSVGYDPKLGIIEVEFKDSGIYQYYDINQQIYAEFMSSSSLGRYLAANIKGQYQFSKM